MQRLALSVSILCVLAGSALAEPTRNMSANQARAVALYAPNPEYPMLAREANLSGTGVYLLNVNPRTGIVESINVVKRTGHGVLDAAAMAALIKWRFKPNSVGRVRMTYTFTLDGQTGTIPRYKAF